MRRIFIATAAASLMATFALAQQPATTEPSTTTSPTTTTQPPTTTPPMTTTQPMTTSQTEAFLVAQPTDALSSQIVGLNVADAEGTVFGEIKDILVSQDGRLGYIVSVGGFLGIGERYVIVSPETITITYLDDSNSWEAKINATKEELEKAPEFKYEGRWEK